MEVGFEGDRLQPVHTCSKTFAALAAEEISNLPRQLFEDPFTHKH